MEEAQDTERLIQPRQPRAARLDPSARQRGFRAANCNDTDELDSGKGGEGDAIVVGMRRVEPEGDGDDVIERFMYWPKADTDDGDTKEQCTYEANDNDIEPEQLVGQWCYLCTDSIGDEQKKWKITSQVQPHPNSHPLALDVCFGRSMAHRSTCWLNSKSQGTRSLLACR